MKRPDRFHRVASRFGCRESKSCWLIQVLWKPVRSGVGEARLASLRELQSATGEELSALLPSVLDRAFKGEL